MKILLTEASSQVAYHLLPMLASGDVIYDQNIELILCGCNTANREMEGLVLELQDCAYPAVTGISITDNFIESCKTADVIISLPSDSVIPRRHGNKEVTLAYTSLTQIDFECLNNAMFPTVLPKSNACSERSHGPLSTANAISRYLSQLYQKSLQDIQREREVRHEEAEFGCPPDPSVIDVNTTHFFHTARVLHIEKRSVFISVTSTSVDEDMLVDKNYADIIEPVSKIFARL